MAGKQVTGVSAAAILCEGTDALVSEQKPLDTLVAGSNPVALKLH